MVRTPAFVCRKLAIAATWCAIFSLSGVNLAAADEPAADARLTLMARSREKGPDGAYVVTERPLSWDARQTAIVVCDMWDDHYCQNAARRVAEMAPRMNEVLAAARKRGVLIVHCPSGCMDFYRDTPQRKLAQSAPPVEFPTPLLDWCYLNETREGALPIDDSVPCDDQTPRERKRFYTRQIETLKIEAPDAITDSAEALYLFRQRGIKNVIVMGVHANKCVLGRPFGIRQLKYQGWNVALMRDMTDAMYNPELSPQVSHFRGTELVVEHVERHWCPTIASTDFTGRGEFRFAEDRRPRIVLVVGGGEYQANITLPRFAAELRERYGCDAQVLLGRGQDETYELPGLEALERADLLVLFLRRRALLPEDLRRIRHYLEAGKPLVALRTASHGFDVSSPPAGRAAWPDFDQEVLGCDYRGYTPAATNVTADAENLRHPILQGVDPRPWRSAGPLYGFQRLDPQATVYLWGELVDHREPIAWSRNYRGGRVFYTSLGHPDDFQQPAFRQLLVGAVFWALDRPGPEPGP